MAHEHGVNRDEILTPHQQAVFEIVREVLVSELEVNSDQIKLDSLPTRNRGKKNSDIHYLGGDSLDAVAIVMAIEDRLNLGITDEHAQKLGTVSDYVQLLVARTDYDANTNTLSPKKIDAKGPVLVTPAGQSNSEAIDKQFIASLRTDAFTIQQVQTAIVEAVTFNTSTELNHSTDLALPLASLAIPFQSAQKQRLALVYLAITKPHETQNDPNSAVAAAAHLFDNKSILEITAMACKTLALDNRLVR